MSQHHLEDGSLLVAKGPMVIMGPPAWGVRVYPALTWRDVLRWSNEWPYDNGAWSVRVAGSWYVRVA